MNDISQNLCWGSLRITNQSLTAIERFLETLQDLVREVDTQKLRVEQAMFKASKNAEKVRKWSIYIEEPIAEVLTLMRKLHDLTNG